MNSSQANFPFMKKNWQAYVHMYVEALRYGKEISEDLTSVPLPEINNKAGQGKVVSVVVCSPHPDDECLTGTLPFRLLRQGHAKIVNLAVTLGSDPLRKESRRDELEKACLVLGFANEIVGGGLGLDGVNNRRRKDEPKHWQANVEALASHFFECRPDLVFLPHATDGHPTHEGTHHLASEALLLYTKETQKEVLVAENEFWQPMTCPNLMVGIAEDDLAVLLAGLTMHKGEIERNPYHLWLPARMMDTVRRGWEIIAGSQKKSPDFCFAELYRLSYVTKGQQRAWQGGKRVFTPRQRIDFC